MSDVILNNWSVTFPADWDGFTAPELLPICLQGIVTGHPRKEDGKNVITSYVQKVNGRRITTQSGTVYLLGRVSPEYRVWCKSQGRIIDEENPIKVKSAVGQSE